MSPRDTSTGSVLESMILPALDRGGYSYKKQAVIGKRLGGGMHKVDVLVTASNSLQIPVSVKWQQVSGTAEQKVPFEIMCLADAVHNSQRKFTKAYLVLGGEGWKLRDYYLSGNVRQYMKNCDPIEIVSLEAFIAKANKGRL
jgi:hypothetical protein